MLKVAELRNLSEQELQEKASSLKKELMQFRFQSKTGKLEQQSTLKRVRRDIARVLTIMNEKSAEGESKPVRQAVAAKPIVPAVKVKKVAKKEGKK